MRSSDINADVLVKSGCYVNAAKTEDKLIKTPNGDIVPAYLSCRLAISNVQTREIIEEELVSRVKEEFEKDITVVGMATAGITWAHSIAEKLHLPLLYIRSKEKEYGLKGLIEGNLENVYKKVIIIDDVLYTGNTINNARKILSESGLETVGVVCIAALRDRIVSDLTEDKIKVINLTDYRSLMNSAIENGILNREEYICMKNIYEENKEEIKS